MARRRPDFFIVGAPKSGTTALFSYLRAHPEVFMCRKERHFFGRDLRPEGYAGAHTELDWYLSFFDDAGEAKRAGDASVWYLSSQTAAEEIHAFAPDADIIIMLRNPVEMMYSLYNMFLWVRDLTPGGVIDARTKEALDFETALATQDERRTAFLSDPDREVWDGDRELRVFHTDAAMYAEQVKRYLEVFPEEQVHIILYDDFKRDTRAAYRQVLTFLEVDPDHDHEMAVVNSSRRIRSTKLHWLLRTHDSMGALRAVGRVLVPVKLRKRVHKLLMDFNVRHAPRPPMRPETRERLQEHFREDVESLGRLLGVNLVDRWYRNEAVEAR